MVMPTGVRPGRRHYGNQDRSRGSRGGNQVALHKRLSLSIVIGGIALTIAAALVGQAMGMVMFQDHGITFLALMFLVFSVLGIGHRLWTLRHESEQQRLLEYLRQVEECHDPEQQTIEPDGFRFDTRELAKAVTHRVSQLEKQQALLQRQKRELDIRLRLSETQREHLEGILNSLTDAVIVTDAFHEVVAMNHAAARLFRADPNRSLRKPVDQIVTDRALARLIHDACESSRKLAMPSLHIEHRIDEDGQQRIFDIFMELVRGGSTASNGLDNATEASAQPPLGSGGVVTILRDITVEKSAAEMRSDFVSNVSHELRTPLSSIKAYLEMLIDGEARDEQARMEFYNIIQGETNRLSGLIDNILNLSRIESGLARSSCERVNMAQLIREAVEIMMPQVRAGRLEMVQHIAADPAYVHADHDMIVQALTNLLSNAVKYTPVGGMVTVKLDVDDQARQVSVSVRDTGVGIPRDSLPHLFEKFYRVPSHRQLAKGTGLGLNMVRQIIEHVHGGTLSVDSTPDVGSTFTFTLPIAEEELGVRH